jgi:hypothetical protein
MQVTCFTIFAFLTAHGRAVGGHPPEPARPWAAMGSKTQPMARQPWRATRAGRGRPMGLPRSIPTYKINTYRQIDKAIIKGSF